MKTAWEQLQDGWICVPQAGIKYFPFLLMDTRITGKEVPHRAGAAAAFMVSCAPLCLPYFVTAGRHWLLTLITSYTTLLLLLLTLLLLLIPLLLLLLTLSLLLMPLLLVLNPSLKHHPFTGQIMLHYKKKIRFISCKYYLCNFNFFIWF